MAFALLRLANEDYPEIVKRIGVFARAFEKQWFAENKTSGFDVQDLRLGGLMQRLTSCKRRLIAYAKGEISRIEELECEVLPFGAEGESIAFNSNRLAASTNVH